MYANKTIFENISKSKDHTTVVATMRTADLSDILSGSGPFTLFAPTNAAFAKLPTATYAELVRGQSKATLTSIISYHVVAGTMSFRQIAEAIAQGGGTATLTTIQGEPLAASLANGRLTLTDVKGGKSVVTTKDVWQSNGVVHVVDAVLMP